MIRGFTRGGHAVVAPLAHAPYLRVIHASYWHPRCGGVAGIARVTRRNVIGRFPGGRAAVVASHTGHGANRAVIEARWYPRNGDMACVTLRARRDVIR